MAARRRWRSCQPLQESDIRSINVYKKDGSGIDPDAANGMISIETRAKQKKQ